jgi:hypothetical protein
MASTKNWHIDGEYFESCNCELLCPCLLSHAQARPTDTHCDVVLAIHIADGHWDENVDLSGLNAVQALTTPGPMSQGDGTLAVYIDARANVAQREALEKIFTGNAGGPPSLMAGMIAHRLPTKTVPIHYESKDNTFKLSIPEITDVAVAGVTGANGRVVWLENVGHPFSHRLAAAKAGASHYKDHALNFDNSGRNGHFSPITWSNAK